MQNQVTQNDNTYIGVEHVSALRPSGSDSPEPQNGNPGNNAEDLPVTGPSSNDLQPQHSKACASAVHAKASKPFITDPLLEALLLYS